MKPKPPPTEHRRELLRVLLSGLSRVRPVAARGLSEHDEQFLVISWTYLFYGSYRDMSLDLPGINRILDQPEPTEDDIRAVDSLVRRWLRLWHLFGDSALWLSHLIAKPDLRVTVGEVQRYLANTDGIASSIRAMLKKALTEAWQRGERVLLIGHSLGSVIAYDSLWELCHEDQVSGKVDLLITLGSPLATRFVRKSIKGADRPGPQRYPTNIRRWANFSARGELTALHPRLKPFFGGIVKCGSSESLEDHAELYNSFRGDLGLDPHKSYGYLANSAVATVTGDWLEEQT